MEWGCKHMGQEDFEKDKYGLPVWDSMIPMVLKYMSDKNEVSAKVAKEEISDMLNLPNNLRNRTYEKDPSLIIVEDHAYWCMTELTLSGALTRVSRGVYEINDVGRNLLKQNDDILTKEYIRGLRENKSDGDIPEVVPLSKTNEDLIEDFTIKVDNFNSRVASNLLKRIQDSDPAFFENLVVKLLVKMGYKGQNGNAKVTQVTNDGGIDGIINQDALGTSTVYVQAKRSKDDNVVQRPAIDGFYGALSRVHADRGVFITTSHFSSSAIATAKGFSIVLVDGIQLTNLMLQYHVGVQVKKSLDLFEIDEDFFEN